MPYPTPKEIKDGEEGKKRYLEKCFHVLKQEGKPQDVRIAQCLNMWREAVKKHKAKGNLDSPTWEEENESGPFVLLD